MHDIDFFVVKGYLLIDSFDGVYLFEFSETSTTSFILGCRMIKMEGTISY